MCLGDSEAIILGSSADRKRIHSFPWATLQKIQETIIALSETSSLD